MDYPSDPELTGAILPFSRAVRFHGHICPGLAIGYYASHIGMRWRYSQAGANGDMVAIVENDGCGIDAVQAITGCTVGKGNLFIRDYGKQVYTFMIKGARTGLRISLKPEFAIDRMDPGLSDLRARVSAGVSPEEAAELPHRVKHICRTLLEAPGDMVFDIREVAVEELPGPQTPVQDVICAGCGEPVSPGRAKKVNSGYYCQPCQLKQ